MKGKTLKFLSVLILLCFFLSACAPALPTEETGSTASETESTVEPTESEEAPIESEEAPIESEEAPIESEEAPIESEEIPAESTGEPSTDAEPQSPYVFREGTRRVTPYPSQRFTEEADGATITVSCRCNYKKHKLPLRDIPPGAEDYAVPCSHSWKITGREGDRVTEITGSFTQGYDYEANVQHAHVYVIPDIGTIPREISFTNNGREYTIPYVSSIINDDGFVWDIYGKRYDPLAREISLEVCRQTSAFHVSLGSDLIAVRPDEITDRDALVDWVNAFLTEAVDGFAADAYPLELFESSVVSLDFSIPVGGVTSILNVRLRYGTVVNGLSTNEGISVFINERGDIKGISYLIHGADWSTVPQTDGTPNSDAEYWVTSIGILRYETEWPGNGHEGIPWLWIPWPYTESAE